MKSKDIHPHGIYRLSSGSYAATGADPYQANSVREVYLHPVDVTTRWPPELWDRLAAVTTQAEVDANPRLRCVVPTLEEHRTMPARMVDHYVCPADHWAAAEPEVARAIVQRLLDNDAEYSAARASALASEAAYVAAGARFVAVAGFGIVAGTDQLNALAARLEAADAMATAIEDVDGDGANYDPRAVVTAARDYRRLTETDDQRRERLDI